MLSAQTQTLDQGAVTVDVNALEVIKHTTTVADHQQQTTTGAVSYTHLTLPTILAV